MSLNMDVGDIVGFRTKWIKDGTAVTTGTATMQITTVQADGTLLYVQSDLSLSVSSYTFTLTLSGEYWQYPLTVDAAWDGLVLTATRSHSDADLRDAYTNFHVTAIEPSARF